MSGREVVPFRVITNGISSRRNGYKIGTQEALVVAWASQSDDTHYRIFNVWTGEPVIPNRFASLDECIRLAELLDEVYNVYWDINRVWPELPIISGAQWSLKDARGVQLNLALSSLEKQDKITITDVLQAIDKYKDEAETLKRRNG